MLIPPPRIKIPYGLDREAQEGFAKDVLGARANLDALSQRVRGFQPFAERAARESLEISDAVPRRPYAAGGDVSYWAKAASRSLSSKGATLNSDVPGRTDKLPIKVKSGSYVVPADIVSGMGQGNTAAGTKAISRLVSAGKFKLPRQKKSFRKPANAASRRVDFNQGGAAPDVPIIAAGGEHIVTPEEVTRIGRGDMERGHNALDKWVLTERKRLIKTLKGLKGPKKN